MKLCVFCGASPGHNSIYKKTAAHIGRLFAERGITLIYGGGRTGLMGAVADAALEKGGTVIGVMPQHLIDCEIQHTALSQFHVVDTMHERKTKLAELSDGFIALPGGAGTFEEILEQWTWANIGVHNKPCAFLNVNGYYDHLRRMVDHGVAEGFIKPENAQGLLFTDDISALFDFFSAI